MNIALNIARALVAVLVLILAGQMFASETGEVVVITTRDAAGEAHRTRVWVVDTDGQQWIRAGSAQAAWYQRLLQHPTLELDRGGASGSYTIEPVPAKTALINTLMAEKYGWADWYVGKLFSRDNAIAMRLVPAPSAPDEPSRDAALPAGA